MKILLECMIDIESGPVFTLGLAKGLVNNGVDVYVIINKTCENIQDWKVNFDSSHLYILDNPLYLKKKPLKTLKELFKIKKKFEHIVFDYFLDTFPFAMPRSIQKVINYKNSIGIDHDAIPHSSADEDGSIKVKEKISSLDYVLILSKIYVDIVSKKYNKPTSKILYMRHGVMEYPTVFSKIECDDKHTINFLYFGRIDGYKGLHVLYKAYENLSRKYSNISLTIAGGGDFSEYEVEYSGLSNCKIVNRYITDEEIATFFSRPNTIVVLPYLDASQSGVIGMAFNFKNPVIVSDTGGLKEQLFDGDMGLFVKPADSADLESKMEQFVLDKKLYDEQVNLMKLGYKKTTWDYVTKELLEQLEKIIA